MADFIAYTDLFYESAGGGDAPRQATQEDIDRFLG